MLGHWKTPKIDECRHYKPRVRASSGHWMNHTSTTLRGDLTPVGILSHCQVYPHKTVYLTLVGIPHTGYTSHTQEYLTLC